MPLFSTAVVLLACLFTSEPPHEELAQAIQSPAPIPIPPEYFPRGSIVQVSTDAQGNDILNDAANEPSIAVDPTAPNRMVITWRQFDNIASNFREAGYAWTNDGGRTWHPGELDSGTFRSDPVIRAGPDGVFYWNSLTVDGGTYECDIFRSADGGQSWSAPSFAYGGDKQWMAIDHTAGPGRGFQYHNWSIFGNQYTPNQWNRSIDDGMTWSFPQILPAEPIWGTSAVGPSGEYYVFGRAFSLIKSTDAQNGAATPTFTNMTPTPLSMGGVTAIGTPPNPGGLIGQAQVVVDTGNGPRRGWVYVLASVNPPGNTDAADITFRRSEDGGVTWGPLVRINPDPPAPFSFQWFGTISIAPTGRLDVVYNDTSHTNNERLSRTVYTSSADGGTTWSAPLVLTPTWDSLIGWPNQNKIGDYYDMESDALGCNVAISTTLTGGQDVYYIRIGPRDCNRNGIDDATDILAPGADCNANGIPDSCEIAAGAASDSDNDGILDACDCDADVNCDGAVNGFDIEVMEQAVNGDTSNYCQPDTDFNHDGAVNGFDVESVEQAVNGAPC
ncbi:hypothetical protein PHYC_03801 [Phycisphaerales bacterium]|nr:hypothetical protein PHYC_03801 [Phycisphaerales bacterium]